MLISDTGTPARENSASETGAPRLAASSTTMIPARLPNTTTLLAIAVPSCHRSARLLGIAALDVRHEEQDRRIVADDVAHHAAPDQQGDRMPEVEAPLRKVGDHPLRNAGAGERRIDHEKPAPEE